MAERAATIRVTPDLRLTQILEKAADSPVLLESSGVVYRLSKESEASESERVALVGNERFAQEREERIAIVEQIVKLRESFFHGQVLPDDSTDLLRRERDERSRDAGGR